MEHASHSFRRFKILYRFVTAPQIVPVSALFEENQSGAKPRHEGFQPPADLQTAILRAQEHLLSIQKPEGYWVGELMVDSTLVSDMVAYHHWAGDLDAEW